MFNSHNPPRFMDPEGQDIKIPLPNFLKLLTSNDVPIPKAMAIAGKVYKVYNTPAALSQLNDTKLVSSGLENKEDRKLLMNALRKAGYAPKVKNLRKVQISPAAEASTSFSPLSPSASSSQSPASPLTTPTKRKRKRPDDTNEFLPEASPDEIESDGFFNFGEVLDEEILKKKSTVINRAPVMMAWAMVVAERIHFSRAEALSIASVYTELNAVTKGVSLGIFSKDKDKGREAVQDGSQPYVDLMGRRIPLYRTQGGQWRALSDGSPSPPSSAFSYISRSFRQTMPFLIGAMKLLAESYAPNELNEKAWSLYADFRPEVNEWGKRSEVQCMKILDLRKRQPIGHVQSIENSRKPIMNSESSQAEVDLPLSKKAKGMSWEEYEATLDEDTTFDHVNLDYPTTSEKT